MGGGNSGGSSPSASETGAENRKTAQYNTELSFVDQYTPDGSYIYTKIQNGNGNNVPPRYRLDTTLSETGQKKQTGLDNIQLALLGLGEGQLGRVADAVSEPFDWSAVPEVSGRDAATENAMKYLTYGYDDRFSRAQSDLESKLAAQGLRPGTEAYTRAMDDFNLAKNKAYETAGLQAYNTGLTEQQAEEQLRQQAIQEQSYARSLPLNELSALISGTQVSMPTFTSVSTDKVAQQPYYQQAQTGSDLTGQLLGTAGSLGSAAILGAFLSTKEAKTEMQPAESVLGKLKTLRVGRWKYLAGRGDGMEHIGPYAEDWAERFGGTGKDISVIDAIGVCLKAIQELAAEVETLKAAKEA